MGGTAERAQPEAAAAVLEPDEDGVGMGSATLELEAGEFCDLLGLTS